MHFPINNCYYWYTGSNVRNNLALATSFDLIRRLILSKYVPLYMWKPEELEHIPGMQLV
jgi:hypothetical protein